MKKPILVLLTLMLFLVPLFFTSNLLADNHEKRNEKTTHEMNKEHKAKHMGMRNCQHRCKDAQDQDACHKVCAREYSQRNKNDRHPACAEKCENAEDKGACVNQCSRKNRKVKSNDTEKASPAYTE